MRVFTVLGPSQSGKSKLLEGLIGLEPQSATSLDLQSTATAKQFTFMKDAWCALDIAGGSENLSTAGPALAASDAAVLCVGADPEGAVLAAPFFRLIEEAGVPCFLFVNRLDAAQGRISEVIAALQVYCREGIALRQVPIRDGGQIVGAVDLISERAWAYQEGKPSALIELPNSIVPREQEARTELLEALADFDDALLEQLIEDQQPLTEDIYGIATTVLQQQELVPALLGSALHRNGMLRLMKSLRHETPLPDAARTRLGGAPLAIGCLGDHVKHLGKTILVRAFDTGIGSGEMLGGQSLSTVTALDVKTPLSAMNPGQMGLMMKSDHLNVGQAFTRNETHELPSWAQPRAYSYVRAVVPCKERDEARLSTALERLTEIDLGLKVHPDPQTGHAVMSMQGPQHFRRVAGKLFESFSVDVDERRVAPAFRETIRKPASCRHRHRKQSGGAGQFADVEIDVRPLERGAGIVFDEVIKGGAVPRNYIPAVEAGVRDAVMAGPKGYPVVDMAVTLTDGKHHAVDSSDFAFRTAGKNAMREAMAASGVRLLEPIVQVRIHVPSIYAGGLVPTVSSLKGQVLGFEGHPTAAGWDVFRATLPMTALDDLSSALASASRGTGWFTAAFDRYVEARVEDFAKI